jgi:hypothetical protein
MALLGIDGGGTFIDAILVEDGRITTAKAPSAARQNESMLAAARVVGAVCVGRFTHEMTIATNVLLERKGVRTPFVSSAGFEHLLHLRRQTRAHLSSLCAPQPGPLAPPRRYHGAVERMGPTGVVSALDPASVPVVDTESITVFLLFSFRDPSHERAVAEVLRRRPPGAGTSPLRTTWRRSSASTSAPRQPRPTHTLARSVGAIPARSATPARSGRARAARHAVAARGGDAREAAAHPRRRRRGGDAVGGGFVGRAHE